MAYVIGLLTSEEEKVLESRGWEVEAAPQELIDKMHATAELPWWARLLYRVWPLPSGKHRMRMVWVDQSMLALMSGPDWDNACDECGADDPTGAAYDHNPCPSLFAEWHKDTCSLHPQNHG